jgi:curli biogenesis system outer membrane secretion channel CsgG
MSWYLRVLPATLAPFLALAGCATAPEVMNLERCAHVSRVAVLPFTDGPGSAGLNSGNAVAGLVVERLAQAGKYRLVERGKLRAILDEQDLQATDLVDPATAAQIGKLAGVDAVITGSVSEYDKEKTVVYIYVVPVISWRYTAGATVRLVDVENADVIYAHSASVASGKNYTEAGQQAVARLLEPLLRGGKTGGR